MARQTTLNVSLTPTLEKYVRAKVKSGRYESASEVIRDSLRALQTRDQHESHFWQEVNAKIRVGREDIAAGRVVDGDTAMDEIISELDADIPRKQMRRTRKK
jgi:antitoxin ParD1/3/4